MTTSLSRVIVIHLLSTQCLYDQIAAGDEALWSPILSKKDENENQEMNLKLGVSGSRLDRERRQELVRLIKTLFSLATSLGQKNVFKACFQEAIVNRVGDFAVKYN